ncbi:hypothetical protein RAD16_13735 [Bradyrhizobium sp. 18BD]
MTDASPPKPRDNYRPAVTFGGIVHVSRQVSRDDAGALVEGNLVSGDEWRKR